MVNIKTKFREKTFPRWWTIPVIAIMLLLQVKPIQAALLKNLAMLKLVPRWSVQHTQIINPPCDTKLNLSDIKKYLESSALIAPPNPSALTQLGRVLWLEENCAESVLIWEQASKYHYAPAEYELFRVGDIKTLSIEARTKYADIAYNHAMNLAINPKNYLAAIESVNRAFELIPQYRSVVALIRLNAIDGKLFDPSGMWQEMVDVYPDTNAERWYAMGSLDIIKANWESAAEAFTQGAMLTPDSYWYWIRAGNAWEWSNDLKHAITCYKNANHVAPKDITAYLSLGNDYIILHEFQEAEYWYLKAAILFPKVSSPLLSLGKTHLLMGEYAQAQQNLLMAFEIEPTNPSSMALLAQTYYQEGDSNLAEAWMLNAIKHSTDSRSLSNLWVQLGDWRIGWRDCQGAWEAYSNASHARENVAKIQKKQTNLGEVCVP